MNTKFEEAKYINGSITHIYPVETITNMRTNNFQKFSEIKKYLFCPECEHPQLVHNLCQKQNNYFSTSKGQNHISGCSYECDKATKKMLKYLDESPNLNRLYSRLQNCLLMLTKGQNINENPFVICRETDDNIFRKLNTSKTAYEKRYYIPRKRLTNYMDDEIVGELKLFYGTVKLAWFNAKGKYPHRLCIYHLEDERIICSLEFSDNVYSYLDSACKQYGKNNKFKASIAFFTKLTNAEIKYNNLNNEVKSKIFYNGIINDSRKIAFLEISQINRL